MIIGVVTERHFLSTVLAASFVSVIDINTTELDHFLLASDRIDEANNAWHFDRESH